MLPGSLHWRQDRTPFQAQIPMLFTQGMGERRKQSGELSLEAEEDLEWCREKWEGSLGKQSGGCGWKDGWRDRCLVKAI